MTQKDKEAVIAALEEYKGDSTGLIAMTVEDCQRVVREMVVEEGWIPVVERLPDLEVETSSDEDGSTMTYEISEWVRGLDMRGFLQKVRYEVGPVFQGWYNEHFAPCVIIYWMPPAGVTEGGV